MTSKLSNVGWAGVFVGIVMIVFGLLSSFSVTYKTVIIGVGFAIFAISNLYLTEEAEPE